MITRRNLIGAGAFAAGLACCGMLRTAAAQSAAKAAPKGAPAARAFKVTHTDAEWRKMLNPAQYAVLRQEDTEPPFTSPLLEEHRNGIFGCAGCKLDLYSSKTKFESGTGWPSFWAPLEHAVGVTRDTSLGMVRDAVHCAQCGGHLGHVFDDGPKPTGLRYCMNGLALTFRPTSA